MIIVPTAHAIKRAIVFAMAYRGHNVVDHTTKVQAFGVFIIRLDQLTKIIGGDTGDFYNMDDFGIMHRVHPR